MAEHMHPVKRTPANSTIQPGSTRRGLAASAGAVVAALLASLCCVGPVLFVTLGIGAGLASRFEPFRPFFIVLTLGLLALGYHTVYGRKPVTSSADAPPSCGPDGACHVPRNRSRDKTLLWVAIALAALLLTFPQWSRLFA